jgi:hypothetical protein
MGVSVQGEVVVDLDIKELRRLAQIGAKARLQELEQERAAILRSFPGLRQLSARREPARKAATRPSAAAAPAKRRRGRMSVAARKAVSVRMKKYWAQRRASQKSSSKS